MITRRTFLTRSATVATGATVMSTVAPLRAFAATPKRWHDAATWPSGSVPGTNDHVTITEAIEIDADATVAGITIEAGGELSFDSSANVTLQTSENVLVLGKLTIKPSSSNVHTLRFIDIDESKFVGGGMDVLATDVGLWVRENGQLDIAGSPKTAWNRTGDDPTWSSSDELVVTPTAIGDYGDLDNGFESFTKGSAVPTVDGRWTAEVLNLTRNVIIEGQPGGRTHINIHAEVPQYISHAKVQHVGPQEPVEDLWIVYLGRYPVHFHHSGDGSRGSVIDGVVVTKSGGRAFVPHASHGVTMRNCIAYDIQNAPFWWDFPDDEVPDGHNDSNDIVWEDNVAALVRPNDPIRGYQLHGFAIGAGTGNIARRCVATGIHGKENAAGYHWPSKANGSPNVWVFEDCMSHNNAMSGIFVWQNDSNDHVVERFAVYRCGFSGINHGAYTNRYHYIDIDIHECPRGMFVHAKGPEADKPPSLRFDNVNITGSSIAAVETTKHNADNQGVTVYTGGTITTLLIDNGAANGNIPATYEFIDTGLYPSGVSFDRIVAGTVVVSQNGDERWEMDSTGKVTYLDADLYREAGDDRYETAAAISRGAFDPGVAVAYVATGLNFPDALAAGAAAAQLDGPVLLTNTDSCPSSTQTELSRLQPQRIVALGGSSVITSKVIQTLEKYGPVERIAGTDRYDTAAKISKDVFSPGVSVAYVATGENFPDALAAGAAAGVTNGPVLLTAFGTLPSATKTELARLKPKDIVVLGGTAVVSSIVEGQLQAYGPVRRLAGIDRYTTAAEISKDVFGKNVPVVYVATGENFPDALAAAAAAASKGGPVLLTRVAALPSATRSELGRLDPAEIVILGGTGIISTDVASELSAFV